MNLRLTSNLDIAAAESTDQAKPLWPILTIGTFNASVGGRVTVKSKDLDAIVASYDPKVERAAVNIDHEGKGPALGWVERVERRGDVLFAQIENLDDQLRADIAATKYRRPSVELNKKHPVTGGLYLDGLAVLGAQRAAVKGLEISLSDATDVLEYEAAGDPIPGAPAPSTDASEVGQQESIMKKTTSQAAGESSDTQGTQTQTPAVTDARVAELADRGEEALSRLSEKEAKLDRTNARLELREAQMDVREALAALGKRVTPGQRKAGLEPLLIALRIGEESMRVTLSTGSGAAAKETEVSAYRAMLAVLGAQPDFMTPLTGQMADSDEGALEAGDAATPEQQQVALSAGITADEQKRLRLKYPGFYGGAN